MVIEDIINNPDPIILNIIEKELIDFLVDRLKYYMKEKDVRIDIIDASLKSFGINQITKIYKKSFVFNKLINKEIGMNIISSYKRASNILENELFFAFPP